MTDTLEDAMDTEIGNGSPRPQATKSDSEHMDEWLNNILVEIKNDHNTTCEIRVREYLDITTTRSNDKDCWLESDSIDLALALLTKREGRKDVCALKIQEGVQLFNLASGEMSSLSGDDTIECVLKDGSKRFIVVPVNDGPLYFKSLDNEFKKNAEHAKRGVKELPTKQRAIGTHWGLLVIDKKERKARWMDGNLTLINSRKCPGRRKISIMSEAATVAGKILCGIEQVLGSERGKFDAKTAKYIPQQGRHNSFKRDPGACGPYLFAFLEYLYKHPEYMKKLHTAFGFENWTTHCTEMDFDSLYTRVAMQKIIQDKSEESSASGELSLKMTPDVFRIIQPKVLAPWVSTAYRSSDENKPNDDEGLFDRFDFRKHGHNSDSRGNRPGGSSGGSGGSVPPPPPRGPPKEVYDTDEDDDDDDFIYDARDPENSTTSKKALRVVIRENIDHYAGIKTKRLAYERAYETAAQRARAAEHQTSLPLEPPTTINAPPRRTCHPILQWPESVDEIPADFADEHEVPSDQLKLWRRSNLEKIKQCNLGPKAAKDGISVRAILQVLSGAKFSDESQHRLTTIWINDPEVFNEENRKDMQEFKDLIAKKMSLRYEIFDMTEDKATKRPHSGGDEIDVRKRRKTASWTTLHKGDPDGSDELPDVDYDSDDGFST